jgi:hypothetical protein
MAHIEPVLRQLPALPAGYKRTIKKLKTNRAGTLAYILVWDDPLPVAAPVAA